jgi:hypothetical protein
MSIVTMNMSSYEIDRNENSSCELDVLYEDRNCELALQEYPKAQQFMPRDLIGMNTDSFMKRMYDIEVNAEVFLKKMYVYQ